MAPGMTKKTTQRIADAPCFTYRWELCRASLSPHSTKKPLRNQESPRKRGLFIADDVPRARYRPGPRGLERVAKAQSDVARINTGRSRHAADKTVSAGCHLTSAFVVETCQHRIQVGAFG